MNKSLPPNPNLENLKKQAKTLHKLILSGKRTARSLRIKKNHPKIFPPTNPNRINITLREAQHILADEYGFLSWQELAEAVAFKRKFYKRFLSKIPQDRSQPTNQPQNLFSDGIKFVMHESRREAQRLHHTSIDLEHLLLGIIRQKECSGYEILSALSVDINTLKNDLEQHTQHQTTPQTKEIPFTPQAKTMLEAAVQEAQHIKSENQITSVRSCHLLLAITKNPETSAAQALATQNIDYAKLKAVIDTHFSE